MNAEQVEKAAAFAFALGKLKAAQDNGDTTVTLTANEVNGIIWGVKTLRGDRP